MLPRGPACSDSHLLLSCNGLKIVELKTKSTRWDQSNWVWDSQNPYSWICWSHFFFLYIFLRGITDKSGNLQITLIRNAFSKELFGQPYEITRQPQVHMSVTLFFIVNTETCHLSTRVLYMYTCRGGNVCSSSLVQKTKTHWTAPRIKTAHHPASSSQKAITSKNTRHCHQQKYNEIGVKKKEKERETQKQTNLRAAAARKVSR